MERDWNSVLMSIGWAMNYQLFQIDHQGISAGKILTGIILLVLSFLFSKRASRIIEDRLLVRLPMDESIRYTFRQLIYYFLLFISTLFTLHVLSVPITIFTVLGGALAVGIGFGSQNLVNNFISGILVMAERPMGIGDWVEVDTVIGQVQAIGIRSTQIRTVTGVVITVNNTLFIEKNLTNWTKSGTLFTKVMFGVAYGTDVKVLERVVLESLQGIEGVTEPSLMFMDFGDNALSFEVGFRLPPSMFALRKTTESQIRFRLYENLNKAGIAIPFPQRDLHIYANSPVPVKILN